MKTMDINEFYCSYGHAHEALLRSTAKRMGVKLTGEFQPCAGCSRGKGYRKPIPSTTSSRSTRKLQRVFVDLSGKKSVPSIGGSYYAMIVRDDFTRFTWLYFLKNKIDAFKKFEQFLADVRDHGEVEAVRSDNGGKFIGEHFAEICNLHRIRREYTTPSTPELNGIAERGLDMVQKVGALH